MCERGGPEPDTHELPPQLGPDALGLALGRVHGVAQGAQVVVHGQALPHVEGAGAEVAERGVLHRRAELGALGGSEQSSSSCQASPAEEKETPPRQSITQTRPTP